MKCLVTAGPTYEPLDEVRRLTNFSTGGLGTRLANWLTDQGHEVTLLMSEQATWTGERRAGRVRPFTSTESLATALQQEGETCWDAVFHAAAVSDFTFGRLFTRDEHGCLMELPTAAGGTRTGKLPSRVQGWLVELVATPKLIAGLRDWFPAAYLVGWKYEVDGTTDEVVARAKRQLRECRTDACVANGPAYGFGYGLVATRQTPVHLGNEGELFATLERFASAGPQTDVRWSRPSGAVS